MTELPIKFLEKMREILGEEYPAFLEAFDGERQYGLRVNTSKIELEEFERIAPFHLKKIPWISNGYFYEKEDAPAQHPFYAAGLYYLQEPSAMTPASRLPVFPGEKALDLCAAPGGKATAIGALLREEGLLVANDVNTARARALLRNIELFGISNAFVTNEPPYILAERYPEYFDKIMVDAPCSGEGMFRKNPAAAAAWVEKGPEYFSGLQKEIIVRGADMLRPGGMMFYSTCTFSPEENEGTVTYLLGERPEMEVIPMEEYEGFAEGLTAFAGEDFHESCRLCRRIWPHKMAGEGHFMALLRKKGGKAAKGTESLEVKEEVPSEERRKLQSVPAGKCEMWEQWEQNGEAKGRKKQKKRKKRKNGGEKNTGKQKWWNVCRGLSAEQRQAAEEFFQHVRREFSPEKIDVRGDKVYYVPDKSQERSRMHFLRNGLYMGDLKKKRFEPSQPFAMALSKEDFIPCLDFSQEDQRLRQYLRGETLNVGDFSGENGWYLILSEGHPLGFGKLSGKSPEKILKNKYPASWRQNQ